MTSADIDKIENESHRQDGWEVQTVATLTRSQLAELCRLARIGKAAEAEAGKP